MNTFSELIDSLIPTIIFISIVKFLLETLYFEYIERMDFVMFLIDIFLFIFISADLYFRFRKTKNLSKFLRENWLEIIAAIPIYYIIRVLESLAILRARNVTELISTIKREYDSALDIKNFVEIYVSERISALLEESRLLRSLRLLRILRPISILIRPIVLSIYKLKNLKDNRK